MAIPHKGGLPHSDTQGSTPARGFPWIFAACHVLHRLLAPRHPPDALLLLVPRAHPRRRTRSKKPRHAQEPSTAQKHTDSKRPRPTARPSLSTHSYALNTMAKPSLEAGHRSRSPRHPGQTPRPNPPRTTPANPAQPLARPGKTCRGVLRVQNAPEPDSQSIKNTTHQAPSTKPRPTAAARHSKPKPKPPHDTATPAQPLGRRAQPASLEADGIEPTTSCLQSRRSPN